MSALQVASLFATIEAQDYLTPALITMRGAVSALSVDTTALIGEIGGLGGAAIGATGGFTAFAGGAINALRAVQTEIEKTLAMLGVLSSGIGGVGGVNPPRVGTKVRALAGGGSVGRGEAVIVGDGGRPELFVPHSSGTVLPSVPGGTTIRIENVNMYGVQDVAALLDELEREAGRRNVRVQTRM